MTFFLYLFVLVFKGALYGDPYGSLSSLGIQKSHAHSIYKSLSIKYSWMSAISDNRVILWDIDSGQACILSIHSFWKCLTNWMGSNEETTSMEKKHSGVFAPGVGSTKQLWDTPVKATPLSLPVLLMVVTLVAWRSMTSSRGMGGVHVYEVEECKVADHLHRGLVAYKNSQEGVIWLPLILLFPWLVNLCWFLLWNIAEVELGF